MSDSAKMGMPLGYSFPASDGGVLPALDVGDLSRRESDDPVFGVVPEIGVEVVEITPGGAQDE